MKRFFIDATFSAGQVIEAPQEVVQHIHVVRIKQHEIIEIFDGKNNSYHAKILLLKRRQVIIEIIKVLPQKNPPKTSTTLAMCLISNDKMDLVVQKSVELGISQIIPLHCEHSHRIDETKMSNRLDHWQNIIKNSCCQSGQNKLPSITSPIHINDFLLQEYDLKIIMIPNREFGQPNLFSNKIEVKQVVLLIGPEGGFTEHEVKHAIKNNFVPLTLGNLVMRAETAAITGLGILNLRTNNWEV